MGSQQPISKVCVIGAGPSGTGATKYLIAEKAFETIDVFEQRDRVGGIWNYSGTAQSKQIPVPQTDPRYSIVVDVPGEATLNGVHYARHNLEFETPLYDNLETNIPHFLMAYSDKAFPANAPLFPKHGLVLKYLEEYAEDIVNHIHFQSQVVDVRLDSTDGRDQWEVTIIDWLSRKTSTSIYDAVVVATGHYNVPYVPDIKGVDRWNTAYPGIVIHSKAYRIPEVYRDKKVLIIGNSASGVDIAAQVGTFCKQPLLLSSRSVNPQFTQNAAPSKVEVSEVVEFLDPDVYDRAVRFVNGSIEMHIDAIVFATGYFYAFPFLSSLQPPITTHGFRIQDTYQHIFHIEHSSLAFAVMNLKVIPFPLAENQSAVIARVWSGRLSLPSKTEMRKWERSTIADRGNGKRFHVLQFPLDAETLNSLYRWAASAERREGLENDGVGKLGNFWDEREVWMRSKFPDIKRAYVERGQERFEVTNAEELGFDYDKWKSGHQLDR